jgi:hypothetical protein
MLQKFLLANLLLCSSFLLPNNAESCNDEVVAAEVVTPPQK